MLGFMVFMLLQLELPALVPLQMLLVVMSPAARGGFRRLLLKQNGFGCTEKVSRISKKRIPITIRKQILLKQRVPCRQNKSALLAGDSYSLAVYHMRL